jgi:hypothetical protein
MLSSKCEVDFPPASGRQLSDIRRDLKADIEKMEIAGKKAFEVWINEEAPPSGGTWDSWGVCMEAVKACDILIVLSNGDAGWAANAGEVGICHSEMMTGLSLAPAKVRLIALPNVAITEDAAGIRNSRFQGELSTQSLFRGGTVKTEKALKSRVFEALHMASSGSFSGSARPRKRPRSQNAHWVERASSGWWRTCWPAAPGAARRQLRPPSSANHAPR